MGHDTAIGVQFKSLDKAAWTHLPATKVACNRREILILERLLQWKAYYRQDYCEAE